MSAGRRVGDIGEDALLGLIASRLPGPPNGEIWSGDDAAIVSSHADRIVMTTDLLVEEVDFDLAYATPDSIGWKAVAVNASDVAAMGGTPLFALASLALRPDLDVAIVEGLLEGLVRAGREFGVSLVGGDLSRGTEVMLSIAMTGEPGERPVTRPGALVGDAICVTGSLGAAAAGLRVLQSNGTGLDDLSSRVIKRQLFPRPPIEAGPVLARLGATAMIDVSDGFALDLRRLLVAGGMGCAIESAAIPIDKGAPALFDDALDLALTGGEDYELLFTIAADRLDDVVRELTPTTVAVVGRVTDGDRLIDDQPLTTWEERGWDHLLDR